MPDEYIKQFDAMTAIYKRIKQIGMENNPYVLSIRQAILDIPAADVAPVVRCRDCKFTKSDGFGAIYCEKWDRWEMPPDAYCYLGAKNKEG